MKNDDDKVLTVKYKDKDGVEQVSYFPQTDEHDLINVLTEIARIVYFPKEENSQ